MRQDDYLALREIAAQLFAADDDQTRQVMVKKLEAEIKRIDALVAARNPIRSDRVADAA